MKKTIYLMLFVLLMSVVSVSAGDDITCDNALRHMLDGKVVVIGEQCACPFQAQEGRTIVTFDDRLLSSSLARAYSSVEPVSLASGNYKVTLASADAYPERTGVSQPHEQWHVLFNNTQTSGTIDDVPDYVAAASVIQVVDESLFINAPITSLQAVHSYYYEANANSVIPVCAAFDEIPDDNDVPEFGVLTALGIVGLAGLFIYRKRK